LGGRGLTIEEKCVFIQKKSIIVSLKALVWQNVSTLLSMIVELTTFENTSFSRAVQLIKFSKFFLSTPKHKAVVFKFLRLCDLHHLYLRNITAQHSCEQVFTGRLHTMV